MIGLNFLLQGAHDFVVSESWKSRSPTKKQQMPKNIQYSERYSDDSNEYRYYK